jgi:predicted transglutaminase-like cysteine proteinase
MSRFVRLGRILLLGAVCCAGAFLDIHSGRSASVPEAKPSSTINVVLTPPEGKAGDLPVPQLGVRATDLFSRKSDALPSSKANESSSMTLADISGKWSELQPRLLADKTTVAICRSNQTVCSEAARRFLSIVELGRKHEGRVRLGWLNRAINMAIRPESDWSQYGLADFWASPLQTLASGAGDCEDYAIVKYAALRELGILPEDLRLVIVQDDKHEIGHAVVAVRFEQRWLILDNRTMAILDVEDVRNYRPLFALDEQGTKTIATAALGWTIDR